MQVALTQICTLTKHPYFKVLLMNLVTSLQHILKENVLQEAHSITKQGLI